jgi:hypothetical protein
VSGLQSFAGTGLQSRCASGVQSFGPCAVRDPNPCCDDLDWRWQTSFAQPAATVTESITGTYTQGGVTFTPDVPVNGLNAIGSPSGCSMFSNFNHYWYPAGLPSITDMFLVEWTLTGPDAVAPINTTGWLAGTIRASLGRLAAGRGDIEWAWDTATGAWNTTFVGAAVVSYSLSVVWSFTSLYPLGNPALTITVSMEVLDGTSSGTMTATVTTTWLGTVIKSCLE